MKAICDISSSLVLGIAILAGTAVFIAPLPKGEVREEFINREPAEMEWIVLRFDGQSILVDRRSGQAPSVRRSEPKPAPEVQEAESAAEMNIASYRECNPMDDIARAR